MSLEESEVRAWREDWKERRNIDKWETHEGILLRAVLGRFGVHDFNFSQYSSIAYEAFIDDQVIARAEGRDALNRLKVVVSQFIQLRGST